VTNRCWWCANRFCCEAFFLCCGSIKDSYSVGCSVNLLKFYSLVSELNNAQLVGSLTSLFSTNMAISETRNNAKYFFRLQRPVAVSRTAVCVLRGSLFTQFFSMAISWTHISQGRIPMRLRYGGIFNNHLLLYQPVKEFWKSVKSWRSYRREFCDHWRRSLLGRAAPTFCAKCVSNFTCRTTFLPPNWVFFHFILNTCRQYMQISLCHS